MSETNLVHNRKLLGIIGIGIVVAVAIGIYIAAQIYANSVNKAYDKANQTLDTKTQEETDFTPVPQDGKIEGSPVPPDDAPLNKDDIKLPGTG